jgi:hypothetical protein
MKYTFIFLLLSCFSFVAGDKEKYEVKDGVASLNGQPLFRVEAPEKWGLDYRIKTLDGTDVAYLKWVVVNDKNQKTQSNPTGEVKYYEITFLTNSLKCEVEYHYSKKDFAKLFHTNKIILDNKVNDEAIRAFVLIHGTSFSDRMKQGTTVIINNN